MEIYKVHINGDLLGRFTKYEAERMYNTGRYQSMLVDDDDKVIHLSKEVF